MMAVSALMVAAAYLLLRRDFASLAEAQRAAAASIAVGAPSSR